MQSFTVGDSDGMGNVPHPVSNLSQTYRTPALEGEEGLERHGPNVTDSKVHGANMGPIYVLSAPDGTHVGPRSLAIRDVKNAIRECSLPGVDQLDAWRAGVRCSLVLPTPLNETQTGLVC